MTPLTLNNYPVVIQFGYKARRGKDTACDTLVKEFGDTLDIRRYAYGDKLREEVDNAVLAALDVHDGDSLDGAKWRDPIAAMKFVCAAAGVEFDPTAKIEKGYPVTKQRALYQWWGTEYRRSVDPFYWVNHLRRRVERERPQFALISDMRFRNEFAYAPSFKGYNVKLVRPDLDAHEALTTEQSTHRSETELDAIPDHQWYRIITHTSVEDLKAQVRQLMNDILLELTPPDVTNLLRNPDGCVNIISAPGETNA